MFQYCKKCVMPNTKPDLFFDEGGVCDACRSAELKDTIDWTAREKEFLELVDAHRGKNGANYDCVIPVSGGKDSHYQAYIARKYGLNPLLVNFEATKRNALGQKNLENIRQFGDLLEFKKNPSVYKKMCLEGFRRVGDHEWPNHLGIFTIPIRVAVQFGIPLVIWGENSQLEYGGPKAARMKGVLDRRWLEEFGGLLGLRVEDMIGVSGIMREDLVSYFYPTDRELEEVGLKGIFLGYYFKWDAREQVELMKQYGFSVKEDGPVEGTYTNYENLDDSLVSIHDYLKYVKFGFCRATDHACLDIRNARMTRGEAIELVKKYDGRLYRHVVEDFVKFFEITKEEFFRIVDSFTNKALFLTDENGRVIRDGEGDLIKRYQDYN
ncbi:MAG: N-acetyl sugar amidotransferase [Candidatus Spechtbacteria bacterium]|nr:N-acetyl sugar amidotransferase [Candidatus Spechtbacteria bacterium]